MDAGKRRHLATFQTPFGDPVADDDGGFTQAWTALTPDEWVSIAPATQRDVRDLERRAAGTTVTVATHLVVMNYRDDVTSQCRLLFNKLGVAAVDDDGNPTDESRIFNVAGDPQNTEERDVELRMLCTEVK